MNPEVIRLFAGKTQEAPSSTLSTPVRGVDVEQALTQEFDSFLRVSDTLVETRKRLEEPFKKAMERSRTLETELRRTQARLTSVEDALKSTKEQLQVAKTQMEKQHRDQKGLLERASSLESGRQALVNERDQLATALGEQRTLVRDLQAKLAAAELTFRARDSEIGNQNKIIEQYRRHWGALVDHDRQMREAIARLQQNAQKTAEEVRLQFASERDRLQKEIAELRGQRDAIQKKLDATQQELRTEGAALKTTSEALQKYQTHWNRLLASDRELRVRVTQLEKELGEARNQLTRQGPQSERDQLLKLHGDQRSEIERLRHQLRLRAGLERELALARAENDRITTDFARESHHYKTLADQDHATKKALWEKLTQLEKQLATSRKAPSPPQSTS